MARRRSGRGGWRAWHARRQLGDEAGKSASTLACMYILQAQPADAGSGPFEASWEEAGWPHGGPAMTSTRHSRLGRRSRLHRASRGFNQSVVPLREPLSGGLLLASSSVFRAERRGTWPKAGGMEGAALPSDMLPSAVEARERRAMGRSCGGGSDGRRSKQRAGMTAVGSGQDGRAEGRGAQAGRGQVCRWCEVRDTKHRTGGA